MLEKIWELIRRYDMLSQGDILDALIRTVYDAPLSDESGSTEGALELAYHEAGHAIISETLEPDSVNVVSILKNGGDVGGFTSYQQPEDYFSSIEHMENRVIALLGGRAATEIVYGLVDPGCSSDLRRAYRIVSRFVDNYCSYGFSNCEDINKVNVSNELANRKELLVSFEMDRYYRKAKKILLDNKGFLDSLASELAEKRSLPTRE